MRITTPTPPVNVDTLPVMEHFYTLQGEGAHSGKAAYFIRLGGCDIGCTWCDVKESWPAEKHLQYTIEEIVTFVEEHHKGKIVVITGGEPAMYDLTNLTQTLRAKGYSIHIETSGAYTLHGMFDWITLSPKKFKSPLEESLQQANELKVIVFNKNDFQWGEKYASKVNQACKLFLQPEWSKHKKMQPLIVEYIKNNPKWTISLQTHKYLGID